MSTPLPCHILTRVECADTKLGCVDLSAILASQK
jgi:hypothetical protein